MKLNKKKLEKQTNYGRRIDVIENLAKFEFN